MASTVKVKDLIIAAGGILIRDGRVLLVYRPRHKDWSFPKGKLDDGESPIQTAVREVREETGYAVQIRGFTGAVGYIVKGRPKTVLFWEMTPVEQFAERDTDEVGEMAWLTVAEARARMTYALEVELLEKAAPRIAS
jgi:8-oxo-dGTP diphosphatase